MMLLMLTQMQPTAFTVLQPITKCKKYQSASKEKQKSGERLIQRKAINAKKWRGMNKAKTFRTIATG